jgi:lipopolysaccharide export system permease protein
MIGYLDRYLLKKVTIAFAIVFLSIAGLAISLDVLSNADKAEQAGGVLTYVSARLPIISMKLAPMAGLLAALVALLGLSRSGELAAAAALGSSQLRTIRALAPAAFALAGLIFFIGEFAIPPAAKTLRGMGLEPFAKVAQPTKAVWLRDGKDVIRINKISDDEREIENITIFKRSIDGLLAFEIRAKSANRTKDGWRLKNAEILDLSDQSRNSEDFINWPSALVPGSFRSLVAHPSELTLFELRAIANSPSVSPKPGYYYKHWIQLRYSAPISSAIMLLLAIPFAGLMMRGRTVAPPLAFGMLSGFAFFVVENFSTVAAESGAIGPYAGAWGPPVLLLLILLSMASFQERPG